MKSYDVGIIGAGVMGAAAGYELARRGASVALIDQTELPNPRGASVDHSKIFRFAYPETLYVKLAVASLKLWRELEEKTGTRFLTPAGLLLIGGDGSQFEKQSYAALRELNLEVENLGEEELAARYPQFNRQEITQAILDPSGAITQAEAAVGAFINAARNLGVEVFEGERVVAIEAAVEGGNVTSDAGAKRIRSLTGSEWRCEKVLVASGPWTRALLPELAKQLLTTRQEVVYFKPVVSEPSFAVGAFPIFLEVESGFYGFPVHHNGAMKMGNHLQGPPVDAYAPAEPVGKEFIDRCRAFFSRRIPALADAEVTETRICMYNNTPDEDFIIDWHPRLAGVLMATGFSGHGFKFGPLVGRIATELLLDGKTGYEIDRFRLARFWQ